MENYLSGRQAARVLGVPHVQVYRWVRSGRLVPASKQGKTLLFEQQYIEAVAKELAEQQEHEAVTAAVHVA